MKTLNLDNPCGIMFPEEGFFKRLNKGLTLLPKTIILDKKILPTYTKLDTILYISYLKPLRQKLEKLHLVDRGYEEKNAAFTLAETLITLTVLGIVAAITIPSVVRRHIETVKRVKILKAISTYDAAINKMVIENSIKNNAAMVNFAGNTANNCKGASYYFKITEGEGCKFKTADGVWWDISNIQKVIVALKEADLNTEIADGDSNRAFYLTSWFDENSVLRIDDLAAATGDDKENIAKLYDYVNGKTVMKGAGGGSDDVVDTPETPKTGVNNPTYKAYIKGELAECNGYYDITSCYYGIPGQFAVVKTIYDENSVRIGDSLISAYTSGNSYYRGLSNYDYIEYERDENGNVKKYNLYKDGDLKKSYNSFQELKDSENNDSVYGGVFDPGTTPSGELRYNCYAKGTQITLADGSTKKVEDITFEDELRVWDFDNGCLASAKPLFIKKPEIAEQYNLMTFSNGSILKTINQHRIFNKEAGKYTYPMTDDTPIGTTTLLDDGTEVTLVKKEVIKESVEYYNIITRYHINCFASGISTSCRLNNLYPIRDYKYVKEQRTLTPYEYFHDIPREWYDELRLAEQSQDINSGNAVVFDKSLNDYVTRLIRTNDESKHLSLV